MLKFFGFGINLLLIVAIFLRIPKDNVGLASFTTKNQMLDSITSMQRSLNIAIAIGIGFYIFIAIQLNLTENYKIL